MTGSIRSQNTCSPGPARLPPQKSTRTNPQLYFGGVDDSQAVQHLCATAPTANIDAGARRDAPRPVTHAFEPPRRATPRPMRGTSSTTSLEDGGSTLVFAHAQCAQYCIEKDMPHSNRTASRGTSPPLRRGLKASPIPKGVRDVRLPSYVPGEFKFNDEGAVLYRPRGIFGASDAAASDAAALVDDNDGAVLDGDPPMLLDRDDAAADAAVPPYRKCGSHRADELTAGPKGLCSDKCEMIPSQSTTHSLVDEPLRHFRTS